MPAGVRPSPPRRCRRPSRESYYETHGYLVFPEMLEAGEVGVLRAALDEVLDEARGLTETTEKFSVTLGHDGRHHVRRIFNPIQHHKAFHDAAFHPRILDAVETLIGPDIQLHHTKLNLKPPVEPRGALRVAPGLPVLPPHRTTTCSRCSCTSTRRPRRTAASGSSRGATSSARACTASPRTARSPRSSRTGAWSPTSRRCLNVPCPAGGVEMHHCNMLHSSTANRGAAPRSVLIFQYRAADNVALGGATTHFGFGLTVRGENPVPGAPAGRHASSSCPARSRTRSSGTGRPRGPPGPSGRRRSGGSGRRAAQLGGEELAGARRPGELEPDRPPARLDREPEAQERAAPALQVDEGRQRREALGVGGEAERDAVRQPAGFLLVPADAASTPARRAASSGSVRVQATGSSAIEPAALRPERERRAGGAHDQLLPHPLGEPDAGLAPVQCWGTR